MRGQTRSTTTTEHPLGSDVGDDGGTGDRNSTTANARFIGMIQTDSFTHQ